MLHNFYKYQGNGNDFILFDNRSLVHDVSNQKWIASLCNRHKGIGADGVIFLQNSKQVDFEMVYCNADGAIGSMCGNGARCTLAFAFDLNIITKNKLINFKTSDGVKSGFYNSKNHIEVKLRNVSSISKTENDDYVLDTGSPHYVSFCNNVLQLDVLNQGKKIRTSSAYKKNGINVNFVSIKKNHLFVRTYERGVENETLSCGTGVTASALCYSNLLQEKKGNYTKNIKTLGGKFTIKYNKSGNTFSNVWLCGPAYKVFEGKIK